MHFDKPKALNQKAIAQDYLSHRLDIESGKLSDELWEQLQTLHVALQPTLEQRTLTYPLLDGERVKVTSLCQNYPILALYFFGVLSAYQQLHPDPKSLKYSDIAPLVDQASQKYVGTENFEFAPLLNNFGYLIGVENLIKIFG